MIKNKLTDQFEIQVSEEEIDAKIREAYLSMFGNSPYITGDILDNLVKRGKENEKEVTRIIDNIVLDKLFENIRNQVKIVPKHISAEEFTAINEAAYAQVEAERKAAKALDRRQKKMRTNKNCIQPRLAPGVIYILRTAKFCAWHKTQAGGVIPQSRKSHAHDLTACGITVRVFRPLAG